MSYDRSWRTERPRPRALPGGPDAGRWLRPADDYGPGYAAGGAGFWDRGVGTYRQWGVRSSAPAYDRGFGAPRRGGYDRGYARDFRRRGYDRGWAGPPRGWRHAEQLRPPRPVRAPFLPLEAYHRHPELDRPPRDHGEGWAAGGDGALSDAELERAVRRKLREDGWLDPRKIRVSAADGVVTLRGEVGDFMEARYAWDDAWETDGVRGVLNHVTVRPPQGEMHGDPFPQAEEVQARGGRESDAAGARGPSRASTSRTATASTAPATPTERGDGPADERARASGAPSARASASAEPARPTEERPRAGAAPSDEVRASAAPTRRTDERVAASPAGSPALSAPVVRRPAGEQDAARREPPADAGG